MNKPSPAIVFALSLTTSAQAQPTFEKIYLSGGATRADMIELSSHNLLTFIGATGTGVSLMEPDGDVIQSNYHWGGVLMNKISIRKYADNEFYFSTGYYKDSCIFGGFGLVTRIYPVVGRMDSLGHVLDLHHYILNEGCLNLAWDLEITGDKSLITSGAKFILRVDSLGTPTWARYFANVSGFQFVRELPGGDLLVGINMTTAGAVIARMDSAGNFLWCKSYVRPRGMVHDCLIESDSSFIITGYTDSTASTSPLDPLPPGYHPKLFMMRLDDSGDVQWCKGYDSPDLWYSHQPSRIVKTLDGNYAVLATLGVWGYRPFLMKTDLNGDTLWTRSMGVIDYTYVAANMLAYSDGGFFVDGVIRGVLPELWTGAPFIFKIDSLGHFPCSESQPWLDLLDLFPVDSAFALTSVDGATVMPAFASDTVFDPIAVYDACVVANGVQPIMRPGQRFHVRPNPNTGNFTMEFKDPLMAESWYSVYDAMGRLLYQRPLPTGATMEEVDLSRFGKGTYVIKFTDPEGVRYERVVLE